MLRSSWNSRRKEKEILGLLEVGEELKEKIEDEQLIWGVLEVEVEFKEEEEEEENEYILVVFEVAVEF